MKKMAMLTALLAGMAVSQASEVLVSRDSGYVGSIMLEDFGGTGDPATGKQQLVLGSMGGGLAVYDYPANSGPEGYATFNPAATAYDPGVYTGIRTRMYVDQNAGEKMIQFYPSPIGSAGVISRGMAPGLFFALSAGDSSSGGAGSVPVLKEQQLDLSALPNSGAGFRFDPFNYANDAVADHWAVDYFMADRSATRGVEFDRDGDSAGVSLVNMNAANVTNGVLRGTSGTDAQIHLHHGLDLNNASADAYRYVEIRMKGSGDPVELFWSTSATTGIRNVVLEPAGGDSGYHTYLVDFTDEAAWAGRVDYLRLDPNTTPGKTFEVDYVRLIVPDTAMLELQALRKKTKQLPAEAEAFRDDPFDPLFATWLDNQYVIQMRLIHNILLDQSRGSNAAFRVESEMNDLRYMQSRVDGEIGYLRNLPADDGSEINVLDHGAVGDGIADDGAAISNAIAAASGSSTNTVFFPSGKYFIGEAAATGSYHLRLEGINNLLLKGEEGTELIFGNPVRGGIDIVDCSNVRLENFAITYRPLPYTLGTVTEVVSNGYVLAVKAGFPAPTESYFQANDFGGLSRFYSAALLPGSVRPEFSNAAPHLDSPVVTEISPVNFLFEYGFGIPENLLGLNVCFQSRMFGSMAVAIHSSERCRVENVKVYASPGMAFLSNASDMTFINNCYVGPDPELPATFASSNADGIFIRDALMGGLISSNSLNYTGDDFLNIHNLTYPVYDVSGNTLYIQGLDENLLQTGHRIGWIFGSAGEKHISGEAFIENIEVIGSLYKVTCDRTLPSFVTTLTLGPDPARPDYLCVMEDQFHGGVVRGNTFSHGLSRFLLGGRNWLFADNVVEDSLSNPYLFGIGPRALGRTGGEGAFPRNILLERNRLTCQTKSIFRIQGEINSEMETDDLLASSYVDIADNSVTLSGLYGQFSFAEIDDAFEVRFAGNRITNDCDTIVPAFELGNCGDVLLEENSVTGNFTQLYSSESNSVFISANNSFINTPVSRTVYTAWDFTLAVDIAEWQAHAVLHDLQFLASSNTLRLKVVGSDPYIVFPPFTGGAGLDCVAVNMKFTDLGNSSNQLYWRTAASGYSEANSQGFAIRLNPSQHGGFNTYNLLGALNPQWIGADISGLRIDPFSGIPVNSVVEIGWIKLTDGPVY